MIEAQARCSDLTDSGSVCVLSGIRLKFLLAMDEVDFTCRYIFPLRRQRHVINSHLVGSYCGVGVWSVVEVNTAVISACLPTLHPLVQHVLPLFTSLGPTIQSFRFSGHAATSSNDTHMLNQKESNVFHRLPDLTDGHMIAPAPAKSKFVNATVKQVDPKEARNTFSHEEGNAMVKQVVPERSEV